MRIPGFTFFYRIFGAIIDPMVDSCYIQHGWHQFFCDAPRSNKIPIYLKNTSQEEQPPWPRGRYNVQHNNIVYYNTSLRNVFFFGPFTQKRFFLPPPKKMLPGTKNLHSYRSVFPLPSTWYSLYLLSTRACYDSIEKVAHLGQPLYVSASGGKAP